MPKIWFDAAVKVIAPLALGTLFVWNIIDLFVNKGGIYGAADGYNLTSNVIAGWAIFILCMISGFIIPLFAKKKETKDDITWED